MCQTGYERSKVFALAVQNIALLGLFLARIADYLYTSVFRWPWSSDVRADRNRLLGFSNNAPNAIVPVTAAMVINPARHIASKSTGRGGRMKRNNENETFSVWFGTMAAKAAGWVGSAWAFVFAVFTIILWGAAGPYFHYSDTWQLVINTATTVITFLVVFLIQNTQNRDARALHLKLDEVIRAIRSAHNEMISIEHLSDGELEGLTKHYERLRAECEARRKREALKA